jgi:ATP-binding cassette, subfamily F, member 3
MDEPTNHLDIPSREALERALSEYSGTVIMVSHDRYFLDQLATEILHFESGVATYHTGTYSDFYAVHHKAQLTPEVELPKKRASVRTRAPQSPTKQKLRPTAEIEREISALEDELLQLEKNLASPPSDWRAEQYSEIGNRQQAIASQLELLYGEWQQSATSEEQQRSAEKPR